MGSTKNLDKCSTTPTKLIIFPFLLPRVSPNLHGFEVHRPSSKGTKLLLQVIKAIINHIARLILCVGGQGANQDGDNRESRQKDHK